MGFSLEPPCQEYPPPSWISPPVPAKPWWLSVQKTPWKGAWLSGLSSPQTSQPGRGLLLTRSRTSALPVILSMCLIQIPAHLSETRVIGGSTSRDHNGTPHITAMQPVPGSLMPPASSPPSPATNSRSLPHLTLVVDWFFEIDERIEEKAKSYERAD